MKHIECDVVGDEIHIKLKLDSALSARELILKILDFADFMRERAGVTNSEISQWLVDRKTKGLSI